MHEPGWNSEIAMLTDNVAPARGAFGRIASHHIDRNSTPIDSRDHSRCMLRSTVVELPALHDSSKRKSEQRDIVVILCVTEWTR